MGPRSLSITILELSIARRTNDHLKLDIVNTAIMKPCLLINQHCCNCRMDPGGMTSSELIIQFQHMFTTPCIHNFVLAQNNIAD